MGFKRAIALPAGVTTIVSGARCYVRELVLQHDGSTASGTAVLRPLHISTPITSMTIPAAAVAGQGQSPCNSLIGLYAPDGLRVSMPSMMTGSIVVEEEPQVFAPMVLASIPLDTVRTMLGLSTPHPLNGLKKWGTPGVETAIDATWDTAVDSELFRYRVPRGYTREKKWPLIVGHHQLKNDPNTVEGETTLDEACAERGYLFMSPTSLLSDTWPNVLSRQCLDAAILFMIQTFNADPDDINIVGFSLGGQQASSYACHHRDPDGLMARTVCSVAPDWEQLVWQRKQHSNTNLGQSVPKNPGDPNNTLCDPALPIVAPITNTFYRSQQQRKDQMGGAWPGGDNISAVGLEYRASAILAIDPASYAETGPCTSITPIAPAPSAADIPGSTVDFERTMAGNGLWTPHLCFWGEDDALIIIPPLTLKLLSYYDTMNPVPDGTAAIKQDPVVGPWGYKPEFHNVGVWGGLGAHTWDILNVPYYLDWLQRQPRLNRLPRKFLYVAYPLVSKASFLQVTKSAANDLSRLGVDTITDAGLEGWTFSLERRLSEVVIDMARTPLALFNFGALARIHLNTTANYTLIIKNMPHMPASASGTNVGAVTIPDPVAGGNSIKIQAAGAGAMTVEVQ